MIITVYIVIQDTSIVKVVGDEEVAKDYCVMHDNSKYETWEVE